jgi:hypothetical protein
MDWLIAITIVLVIILIFLVVVILSITRSHELMKPQKRKTIEKPEFKNQRLELDYQGCGDNTRDENLLRKNLRKKNSKNKNPTFQNIDTKKIDDADTEELIFNDFLHDIEEPVNIGWGLMFNKEDEELNDEWAGVYNPTHKKNPKNEKYFDGLQKNNHNDDTQNVHDSQIVKEIVRLYARLKELNESKMPIMGTEKGLSPLVGMPLNELKIAITNEVFRDVGVYAEKYISKNRIKTYANDLTDFNAVLDEIRKGGILDCIHEREDWVICQVWRRINSVSNEDMKALFILNLLDCMKEDTMPNIINILGGGLISTKHIECTHGRIARMLNTFTLLDPDKELSTPIKDKKEIENEAYTKAGNIYKTMLDSPELAWNDIGKLVEKDEPTRAEINRIKMYERKIAENIKNELKKDYTSILGKDEIDKIISASTAGVKLC